MQRAWHFIIAQYPGTDVTHALYRLKGGALAWFKSTLGSVLVALLPALCWNFPSV